MKTSDILKQAKARLTPETWGQGYKALASNQDKECAAIAVERTGHSMSACGLLAQVATGYVGDFFLARIVNWNDAPETTLQDVHDAFDASIAIAEEEATTTPTEATAPVLVLA